MAKTKAGFSVKQTREELSVENGDLQRLLGGMSEKAWKNTLYVTQRGPNIGKELASELKNYLGNLSGKEHIDVSRAQESLEKSRRSWNGKKSRHRPF